MATQTEAINRKQLSRNAKIGLFIPCYIDMIYPEVGIAALQLLERFELDVGYPLSQTCCGQPMSNSGDEVNADSESRILPLGRVSAFRRSSQQLQLHPGSGNREAVRNCWPCIR